jgi:hypothetical protein
MPLADAQAGGKSTHRGVTVECSLGYQTQPARDGRA